MLLCTPVAEIDSSTLQRSPADGSGPFLLPAVLNQQPLAGVFRVFENNGRQFYWYSAGFRILGELAIARRQLVVPGERRLGKESERSRTSVALLNENAILYTFRPNTTSQFKRVDPMFGDVRRELEGF